jgi:hypothetical protein
MKNHCEEKALGADPTATSQQLVKDARSLKHSNFHRVRARGLLLQLELCILEFLLPHP